MSQFFQNDRGQTYIYVSMHAYKKVTEDAFVEVGVMEDGGGGSEVGWQR
jgi:hypothetical protein